MADEVPIRCPACETGTTVPVDEADEALAEHNDARHGGKVVAGVPVQTGDGIKLLPGPDRAAGMVEQLAKEVDDVE